MSFSAGLSKTAVVDLARESMWKGVFTGPSGYKNSPAARGQMKADHRETAQVRGGLVRTMKNGFGQDRDFDRTHAVDWQNSRQP